MADRSDERSLILDEAYRCLDRSGGSDVSVTTILANTGLSTRAFYRHFKTRDDLLLVMFRRDRDKVLTELRSAAAQAASPTEALIKWVNVMFSLLSDPRRRGRVMTFYSEEMRRTRGYSTEYARFATAEQALLGQIIEDGRGLGIFPAANPDADSRFITAAIEAAIVAQIDHHTGKAPQEAAAEVLDFALRALGAGTRATAENASPETAGRGAPAGSGPF